MIAICVGHSRGDGGAVSVGGVSEWNFNRQLGWVIVMNLKERGLEAVLIDRYMQGGYSKAMKYLAASLLSPLLDAAVELHFNSADSPAATGHEWLHWHASVPGRALAQALDARMVKAFPGHKRRGLQPIRQEGRGAQYLSRLHCPAVICEPFFGSNPQDWALAIEHPDSLAQVIADGISDWKGSAS